MTITQEQVAALGWPKLKYAWFERERRWLCSHIPTDRVQYAEDITDLYVTDTQLRLREAVPVGGGPAQRRLSRKADLNAATRVLTSIYLQPNEFALLAGLPGRRLIKTRHVLTPIGNVLLSIDRFENGLLLGEAEFEDDAAMAAFAMPDYALREVTDDPRYAGGYMAAHGVPQP